MLDEAKARCERDLEALQSEWQDDTDNVNDALATEDAERLPGYKKGPHWICDLPLLLTVLWGEPGIEESWIHVSQLE